MVSFPFAPAEGFSLPFNEREGQALPEAGAVRVDGIRELLAVEVRSSRRASKMMDFSVNIRASGKCVIVL